MNVDKESFASLMGLKEQLKVKQEEEARIAAEKEQKERHYGEERKENRLRERTDRKEKRISEHREKSLFVVYAERDHPERHQRRKKDRKI